MFRLMQVRRRTVIALLLCILALVPAAANAAPRTFGQLYHDGEVLRTFGLPAAVPHGGRDPLFVFTNGVDEQLSVTQFAPGDRDFHGGSWAVYQVTFTTAPYLITSDEQIRAAAAAGDISITRAPGQDFRCPVLP
jgi:hypothetical protein